MWNTGPSWSSSFFFYLRLVLLSLSSFSQPFAFPILQCFFSGCSWSTPLPCTLRVPVQYVFLLCRVVSIVYGQSNAIFFPSFVFSVGVCFVLCHNFSFEIFSSHLPFKVHWYQFTNIWSELPI